MRQLVHLVVSLCTVDVQASSYMIVMYTVGSGLLLI